MVETGRTCSTQGTQEMHSRFLLEDLEGRENFIEPAIKKRTILKWKTDCEDVNLIEVTQHKDHRVYPYNNMKFYEQIT
jgi:hypothetical protein